MFRFAQPIRFSHCDPAGVLYFPHVFDFVNAAMEDWFAQRLGLPFHVEGAPRFRVRHKTAMMSMDTMRAVALPDEIRERATAEAVSDTGRLDPVAREPVSEKAFRSRQLVRYTHCDPGERVYFPRFFDMFNAALEDWFAEGLGCPWGTEFMVPPRDLRAPSLVIDAEFLRACVLGETLDFDLWVKGLGKSSFELATMRAVPIPDDLRRAMDRFIA